MLQCRKKLCNSLGGGGGGGEGGGRVGSPGVQADPVYLTDVLLNFNPPIGQTKVIYLDVVALQCGLALSC